jgi:hypothetical protein
MSSDRMALHFVMAVRLPGRLAAGTLTDGHEGFTMPGTSRLAEIVIVTGNTTTPFGIDTTVPATARMYDYWLRDHGNFGAAGRKPSEAGA